ncbi:hypothetical protein FCV94_01300 [Listeria monocytogenes]|uniref:WDGH domain-containing protein n=1 Tax=Listeria TaxID=1637 RepID=UPI0004D394A0|nr:MULTISPECIES: hypothetical protein [Listeria]EAA0085204.1 hypothetical protein [Listeria monocytogenes]EAA0334540.1 hypothetical protein [Listeria monocytogenes]EAC2727369.1 hypothetical protein [Listeria monocytogenes]EAC3769322.1 hypothetical protein [Listeria monocytogenes]EAC4893650.1 hypothetical protein [Listeria monocytogenes]
MEPKSIKKINDEISLLGNKGNISDGSHTFEELYFHRMVLFATVCNANRLKSWKSKKHEDGSMFDNYFIVGISTSKGMFSYHYHLENWNYFDVPELEFAPAWDGHTANDVIRLLDI